MWGQEEILFGQQFGQRIIPTRVGTRTKPCHEEPESRDHPHACGDKKAFHLQFVWHRGSSPRVWGQEIGVIAINARQRIIPTRVGTRLSPRGLSLTARDHPHACGDKITGSGVMLSPIGSSPRVWGQGIYNGLMKPYERIIPTRVGTRWERNNLHIQA